MSKDRWWHWPVAERNQVRTNDPSDRAEDTNPLCVCVCVCVVAAASV